MSERLTQIDQQLAFLDRRRQAAEDVIAETDVEILELEFERSQLLGTRAVRHLYAVPDLPPEPNGAA